MKKSVYVFPMFLLMAHSAYALDVSSETANQVTQTVEKAESAVNTVNKAINSAKSVQSAASELKEKASETTQTVQNKANDAVQTAKTQVSETSTKPIVLKPEKANKMTQSVVNQEKKLSAQEELTAAQMNYQALMKSQADERANLSRVQSRLKNAEKKLADAQFEVDKIRAELMLRQSDNDAYDRQLKAASERINKAWTAVHGKTK